MTAETSCDSLRPSSSETPSEVPTAKPQSPRDWVLVVVALLLFLFPDIGTVLGSMIGGAFSDSDATWQWAFHRKLLVRAVMDPIYFLLLPDFQPQKDIPLLKRLGQIEYIGALLSIGTLLSTIMATNFGGVL
ncbi:uncharacterized protein ATNIH1004_009215 [Aspergillus tanneri]|uniref:Uncharacterized protein n=2 Tax=Aspergillus tanneri TaxID=1220188 RepID=A0A5M9MI41_9EURO|nr:uncharacterized protein ATNIH1004_009215 [Aspergillus tanneri]KAA8645004.1 hypothetical protein ATNIH1004_009215 [Aspergillus tanneri]